MCICDAIRFACNAHYIYIIELCQLPGYCLPHIRSTRFQQASCDPCAAVGLHGQDLIAGQASNRLHFRMQQEERMQRFAEQMQSSSQDAQFQELPLEVGAPSWCEDSFPAFKNPASHVLEPFPVYAAENLQHRPDYTNNDRRQALRRLTDALSRCETNIASEALFPIGGSSKFVKGNLSTEQAEYNALHRPTRRHSYSPDTVQISCVPAAFRSRMRRMSC